MLRFILLTFIFVSLSLPKVAYANVPFAVDRDITYTVTEDLITTVEEKIQIENLTTESYPGEYRVTVDDSEVNNILAIDPQEQVLQWTSTGSGSKYPQTQIKVVLPPQGIGRGKLSKLRLIYDLPKSVTVRGQIKTVELPRLIRSPLDSSVKVRLAVNESFGKVAYMAPQSDNLPEIMNGWQSFIIPTDKLDQSGIRIIFGDFQIYNFQLNYYLQNDTQGKQLQTVTWPPETIYQRVAVTEVSENPIDVKVDEDGNWLAEYRLKPGQSKNLTLKGSVMVFAQPWTVAVKPQNLQRWLAAQTFWEAGDRELVNKLSGAQETSEIYKLVTENLHYTSKGSGDPSERKGAVKALQTPDQAICTEFSDTFIALARTAGTPARQVIGYAYSENQQQRPLTLGGDVLHAWPEYWDSGQNHWQPVDPTWEVTTGGTDYFSQWDLYHVVLAINGLNSTQPLAAGFFKSGKSDQRDVVFSFANDFPANDVKLQYALKFIYPWWPKREWQGILVISNRGETIFNSPPPRIQSSQGEILIEDLPLNLPPYATERIPFRLLPAKFWAGGLDIAIEVGGDSELLKTPAWLSWWQGMVLLAVGGVCAGFIIISIKIAKGMRRLFIQK